MKSFKVLCVLTLVALMLGGCAVATKSSHVYTDPVWAESVANTEVFAMAFDDCWQRLISGLSAEFFVITNVEKASGLITLDFGTDSPEDFVDCGTSTRTYGGEQFTYRVAGDSQFKVDEQVGANVARQTVRRDTNLTGKINVHVSEAPEGTRVSVNARYIWTVTVGGYYENVGSLGSTGPYPLPDQTYTKSFNTNAPSLKEADGDFPCGSNGALERLILEIVRANPSS